MQEKERVCTISGMRPQKLPGNLDSCRLLSRIDEEIRRSIAEGYTAFQTGMAMGVDIWAADTVRNLKSIYPEIRLVCFLPCETQADGWTEGWRGKYFDTLAAADDVACLQAHYTAGCMQRRNRKMIESSSRLIAVYDGISLGGTAEAVHYARERGLDVVVINPLECLTK